MLTGIYYVAQLSPGCLIASLFHSDIKLDNILWKRNADGSPDFRLADLAFADFDIGHSLASECGRGGGDRGGWSIADLRCILGTPEYQAPETQIETPRVCRRGGTYTKACDVWSLGKSPIPTTFWWSSFPHPPPFSLRRGALRPPFRLLPL